VGTAGVTITGAGNYSGSLETSFEIIPIDTSGPSPEQISAHSGKDQQATVGTALADTVSVLVSDRYSNPVAGVEVTFRITAGGGEFPGGAADTVMVTNKDGIADSPAWTLGTKAGEQTLRAEAGELPAVDFTATAVAEANSGDITTIEAAQGKVEPHTTEVSLSAFLIDRYENPIIDTEVTFELVTAPSGASGMAFRADSSGSRKAKGARQEVGTDRFTISTDTAGKAEVLFTVGDRSGEYLVEATAAGIGVISFDITAYSNGFKINQNYPNPFRGVTTVPVDIESESQVRMEVFDVSGRRVKTLYDGRLQPGWHRIEFDGRDLPSDVYWVRMVARSEDGTSYTGTISLTLVNQ